MNTSFAVDTLAYSNRLKSVGVPAIHAEAQAEALAEVFGQLNMQLNKYFATKHDLEELRNQFNYKIDTVELKLESKIEALGQKMTIRLGSMLAASVFIVASLHKLF